MMGLTRQKHGKNNEEEKGKKEGRKPGNFLKLILGNVIAGLILSVLIKLSKHKFPIKIESVRKAEGLDYKEEE